MRKVLATYTPEQLTEIQTYVANNFGSNKTDYIAHEVESEYIHTDVLIVDNQADLKVFASIGMGAKKINSPIDGFQNIELMGLASEKLDVKSEESLVIAGELTRLTKFPFSENTWFGPGHTVNVSEEFHKTFGYDYFLFTYSGFSLEVSDIGNINYLTLIPLYENERNYIVKNGDNELLEKLIKKYGADMFALGKPRKSIIKKTNSDASV